MTDCNVHYTQSRALQWKPPTEQAYGEFQDAFDFFNVELFDGNLPHCLITLRKHRNARGYFSCARFERISGEGRVDEIALDPRLFAQRTVEETLSTLVHEMTHLWQAHFGKPPRRAYHDREWASKMKSIGLQPSDTGEPGGKETGTSVSHYIVADGPFAKAAHKLLADGFAISWADRADTPQKSPSGQRVKFVCAGCGDAAWGKESLRLACSKCERAMETA